MKTPTFTGIMTVVVTPFDRQGAIDFAGLGKLVDGLVADGVHWIVPGGTTGEYYAQSVAERKEILAFVAERTGGRAKLAAGTNSARPSEIVELSLHAKKLGYEAAMLAAPYYSLPGTADLARHFREVAAAIDMPIILYNFPTRTGVDMNREFLEAVSEVKSICAIKESSGSFARLLEQVVCFDGRYQRICGADDQAVDHFLWGAKAWIAGASNFLPAEHVALYDACVAKQDFVRGQKLMQALLPLFYLLENGGKYIQYTKYGCELAGHPAGDPRPPLYRLSDREKSDFKSLYEGVKSAKLGKLAA